MNRNFQARSVIVGLQIHYHCWRQLQVLLLLYLKQFLRFTDFFTWSGNLLIQSIVKFLANWNGINLACTALKERYRQQLMNGNHGVQLIYLKGSYDLIWSRLTTWIEYYMKPHMLHSQFEVLKEPSNALTVDISLSIWCDRLALV